MLNLGEKIPSFTLFNQHNSKITEQNLIGSWAVLYFYPKDDTPGCTQEACNFRDTLTEFKQLHTHVFAVSPDTEESHKKFEKKYTLNFPLLADPEKQLILSCGVWGEKMMFGQKIMGVIRTTFLFNPKGILVWKESPVKVEGHISRVLEALHEHSKH